jgi:SAM-dependent methyltransferase
MFLAREFPAARVRGVDTSERAIRRAVARVGLDPEGRVAFKHGGRRALPYPNDHFDLVVQAHGRPLPARVARVLRPGGHFVYVERRGARRLPRPGPLRSALGRLFGFQTVEAGEAEGARFVVARLRDPA